MWWWLIPLGVFGYLFIAGATARWLHDDINAKYGSDEIGPAVFWPVMLAALILVAVVALPWWLGVKTMELPGRKLKTQKARDAETRRLEAQARAASEREQAFLYYSDDPGP